MPNKFYPIVIALLLVGCGGEETKSPPLITISDVGTAPTPAPAPAPTSVVLCTNPHNAEHPTTFNGKFEVPTPAYTLPQNYQRGISFKDYSPNNHIDKNGNRLGGPNCDQEQFVKLM